MKKKLPLICLLLASCSSIPSLEDNVKDAQLKTMKDPTSYELLSLDKYKDITYGEEIQSRIEQQLWFKESAEKELDFYTNSVPNEEQVIKSKEKIAKAENIISGLENLKITKADSLNVIAATIYTHKFNGKNSLGMIVPNLNFAVILPDGSVKEFAEDEKSIPLNPNDFQEYFQLLK